MNKGTKILITIIITIGGLIGLTYYNLTHIDFIGQKDPEVVRSNLERWEKILLEAEYRDGPDYCKIILLDSVNIEINVGDASVWIIVTETYKLVGDTIIIVDGIKQVDKYLNSPEMIIQNDRILYLKDSTGNFDVTKTMKVKSNKLKQ